MLCSSWVSRSTAGIRCVGQRERTVIEGQLCPRMPLLGWTANRSTLVPMDPVHREWRSAGDVVQVAPSSLGGLGLGQPPLRRAHRSPVPVRRGSRRILPNRGRVRRRLARGVRPAGSGPASPAGARLWLRGGPGDRTAWHPLRVGGRTGCGPEHGRHRPSAPRRPFQLHLRGAQRRRPGAICRRDLRPGRLRLRAAAPSDAPGHPRVPGRVRPGAAAWRRARSCSCRRKCHRPIRCRPGRPGTGCDGESRRCSAASESARLSCTGDWTGSPR